VLPVERCNDHHGICEWHFVRGKSSADWQHGHSPYGMAFHGIGVSTIKIHLHGNKIINDDNTYNIDNRGMGDEIGVPTEIYAYNITCTAKLINYNQLKN